MNLDIQSSGFIDEIGKSSAFEDLSLIYTSTSGYTCLYTGVRYGKKHILKALQEECTDKAFYEQSLRKEFAIGYQLDHTHIVHTVGCEVVDSIGRCIVMEFVDGITLRELMDQGKLTEELARKIVMELCTALQYLHNKQIIHRDLKPENVMITHNGNNVKLIDFGLSDCDDYTLLKLPAGTRYYMAPEALLPHEQVDCRADIYSLGIIIGEMASLLKNSRLARISNKCTQQKRERRFSSAMEVYEALNTVEKVGVRQLAAVAVLLVGACLLGYGIMRWEERKPAVAANSPAYGNVVENEECHQIFMRWQRLQKQRKKQCSSEVVSLNQVQVMDEIRKSLERAYPQEVMRNTATYRELLRYWEARLAEL